MNITFLAPRLPYPADTGGKIRTLNLLKQMTKFNNVQLLCFSFEPQDEIFAKQLSEKIPIKINLCRQNNFSVIEKVLKILFSNKPISVEKYFSDKMKKAILNLPDKTDYIHIDHIHMAHYTELFPNATIFVDEHNVEYKILERCAVNEKSWILKSIYKNQAKKMKIFEKNFLCKSHACFAVSEDDQKLLNNLTNSNHPVHIVHNGVDTEFFNADSGQGTEHSLVFTGSMDWRPNNDAMIYFLEKIWPLLKTHEPNLKMYIVGKSPSQKLINYAGQEKNLIVTGRVEDVRAYINNAKVFIVPLRIGGGTRLKILEAMSMKKAVVSTTVGAEGIDYENDLNISIADTPEKFAVKIIKLLNNPQKRIELGNAARQLVCSRYDWNIIGKNLNNIYHSVHLLSESNSIRKLDANAKLQQR